MSISNRYTSTGFVPVATANVKSASGASCSSGAGGASGASSASMAPTATSGVATRSSATYTAQAPQTQMTATGPTSSNVTSTSDVTQRKDGVYLKKGERNVQLYSTDGPNGPWSPIDPAAPLPPTDPVTGFPVRNASGASGASETSGASDASDPSGIDDQDNAINKNEEIGNDFGSYSAETIWGMILQGLSDSAKDTGSSCGKIASAGFGLIGAGFTIAGIAMEISNIRELDKSTKEGQALAAKSLSNVMTTWPNLFGAVGVGASVFGTLMGKFQQYIYTDMVDRYGRAQADEYASSMRLNMLRH